MQNKDNLEEFIKSEVNKIELGGADAMWEGFQGRLEKEASNSKKGYRIWLGLFPLLFIILLGGFFINKSLKLENTQEALKEDTTTLSSDNSTSSASTLESDIASASIHQNELKQENALNPAEMEKQANRNTNANRNANSNSNSNSNVSTNSNRKANANSNANSNVSINSNRDASTNASANSSANSSANVNTNAKLNRANSKSTNTELAFEKHDKENVKKSLADQKIKTSIQSLSTIGIKPLGSIIANVDPTPSMSTNEWDAPVSKAFFVSLENSFAQNNISQHSIGVGFQLLPKNNFGIKVQTGLALDQGYSFSQDSLLVINGLSIEEIRKDKDLKNLWNAYLDFGLLYSKNKWNFGTGIRGGFAFLNQFYFNEVSHVTHIEVFRISGGTGKKSIQIGNWSGINRLSLDVYLNTNYQINQNYSVGLMVGKRLNELIKTGMAQQAYSNTPVKFGVLLNKYF